MKNLAGDLPAMRNIIDCELRRWNSGWSDPKCCGNVNLEVADEVANLDGKSRDELRQLRAKTLSVKGQILADIENWRSLIGQQAPITWNSALFNTETVKGVCYIWGVLQIQHVVNNSQCLSPIARLVAVLTGQFFLVWKGCLPIINHSSLCKRFVIWDRSLNLRGKIEQQFEVLIDRIDQELRSTAHQR